MYLDAADFPFTATLEREWRAVRDEFAALSGDAFMAWPEEALYDQGWEVFGLYAFGVKMRNCRLCPRTVALVEAVPGFFTAGFSLLRPGTHIRPHVGYSHAVLRCHLGLVVPEGCWMRVGQETRSWQEGRCLVFDDTTEHEVWHRGAAARAILLVDFRKAGPERRSREDRA